MVRLGMWYQFTRQEPPPEHNQNEITRSINHLYQQNQGKQSHSFTNGEKKSTTA